MFDKFIVYNGGLALNIYQGFNYTPHTRKNSVVDSVIWEFNKTTSH